MQQVFIECVSCVSSEQDNSPRIALVVQLENHPCLQYQKVAVLPNRHCTDLFKVRNLGFKSDMG